ncbi:MAG: hypothetical protein ABIZ04_22630 [Opitutus sp.]
MISSRRFRPVSISYVFIAAAVMTGVASAAESSLGALGVFSQASDVGRVSLPVAVAYDAAQHLYTVGASGANMWGSEDAFGFVWKEVTGDIALAATVGWVGASPQGHRKACLVIRQSLDPRSAYADVAVHGDGHTSLQFRRETGGPTQTTQCPGSTPQRLRVEKRGSILTVSVAAADGMWVPSGCATELTFSGRFYVGLAVCAHDNAAFETATFSAVELATPEPMAEARTYSLEVITVASSDRRVVYRAATKMDAPHFSPDGSSLFFNRDGRIERVNLSGDQPPVKIDTGFTTHCINDHGISPDGTQLVISDLSESGKSQMYLLPIAGGVPKRVEVAAPALWHGWSPDGQTLTYCAERNRDYDVYTVPVRGGVEQRLTTAPGNDNGPDYSADGRWIYFHSVRSGRFQIWRMHSDGSDQEQVTHDEYFNWFPHPSPDGRWIAILSSKTVPDTGHPPDGPYTLRLLPTAGGAPRELASFHAGNGSFNVPCWSRDSTRLAFASYVPQP